MATTPVPENRLYPSALEHNASHTRTTTKIHPTTGQRRLSTESTNKYPGYAAPIGAYRVATSKRLLQIGLALVSCLLSAGVIFGYAALKPVLITEGIYRDKCTPEEIEEGVRVCYQQELKLNLMFTVAAVATNVCALVVGTILDRYGPRIAGVIGSLLFAMGCTGFGLSKHIKWIDPYPASYLLMALGGPFIFIPSFHLANAFPRRSGLILAMLTGAFDSSPAIFLLYRLIYQSALGPISLRNWFIGYLAVPLFIFVAQIFAMPAQSYKTTGELEEQANAEQELLDDEFDERGGARGEVAGESRVRRASRINDIDALLGRSEQHDRRSKDDRTKTRNKGVYGAMHGKNIKTQLSSFWFWAITGFTIVQMTRTNYFVATIRPQYEFLLHSYEASVSINTIFDIALPLGGLAAIPFIGTFLDTFSTLIVLSTLVACATLMGLLGVIQDSYLAAYLNILIFVTYRPFYYTVVSDYCVKVFGVATFGKVYGTVICLAGLVNLSSAFLDKVTFQWCGGDPRPVNALLLLLGILAGTSMVVFVRHKSKEIKKDEKKPLITQAMNSNDERPPAESEGYGTLS